MRCTLLRTVAVCALFLTTMPEAGSARSVDYSIGSVGLISSGQELKITPLTTELRAQSWIEAIESSGVVDHITESLGIGCSAYKVENPISLLFPIIRDEWNSTRAEGKRPDIRLSIMVTNASSYRRCVFVGEMNMRCISRVRLNGTAQILGQPDTQTIAISADVERDASVGGFCGNLSRGVGVISREAVLALLVDAEHKTSAYSTNN